MKRFGCVFVGAAIIVLGAQGSAYAVFTIGPTCSSTNLNPGQTITITGSTNQLNQPVRLIFNGVNLGVSFSNALTGNFSVSGTIPADQPPGVYVVQGNDTAVTAFACNVTVSGAAATPTPVPTAVPTAAPDDDDDDGGGDNDDGGLSQNQRQEQSIVFPVAAQIPFPIARSGGGGGSSLPKTGADVAEVGGIGTVTLLAGVSLMEFARRRRRHWLAPVPSQAVTMVPTAPTPVAPEPPRAGETEADLMLPYTATSPPPPSSPTDFITPTF